MTRGQFHPCAKNRGGFAQGKEILEMSVDCNEPMTVSEAIDLLKELVDDLQVYSMPDLIRYLKPGTRELMAFSIVAATASLHGLELPGMREYFLKNRIDKMAAALARGLEKLRASGDNEQAPQDRL
jgi:hypothetical protein